MIGFFFRLSITAISPWTCRSSAFESQVLGDEPYKGVLGEGVKLREKREGRRGA
jgi:hypothetical protein